MVYNNLGAKGYTCPLNNILGFSFPKKEVLK